MLEMLKKFEEGGEGEELLGSDDEDEGGDNLLEKLGNIDISALFRSDSVVS